MFGNKATLARIQKRVTELASVIGAPAAALPTFGSSEDFARPHIEVQGELPYYVVVERGEELVRDAFVDEDALLERIFRGVTSQMAVDYELRNRRPAEDFRRLMFARQLELLAMLDQGWAAHERERLRAILREHPFSDGQEPRDGI